MKYSLDVIYTEIPSEAFIVDAFGLTKGQFSEGFNIGFVSRRGNKWRFRIESNKLDDIYTAGLVGAVIEKILLNETNPL